MSSVKSTKLPLHFENPIDSFFISLSYYLGPVFKQNKLTPNMLTTLSLIFGLLSIYSIEKNKFKLGAIFYILMYFLDCCDGNFARRYNMESKLGDYYDHIKDSIIFILLLIVLVRNNTYKGLRLVWIISCFVVLSLTTLIFHGCTELYIRDNRKDIITSSTLSSISGLCYSKPEKVFRQLRYISNGSLIIFIVLVILGLGYKT